MRKVFLFLAITLFATIGGSAFGQSTEGIRNKMPPSYRMKIVRPGEQRTSEFFFTAEITGAAAATALTTDKASHAAKFVGVKAYCLAVDAAVCVVPVLTKNGTPITDQVVVAGGQAVTIPFNEVLVMDTSDSIAIQGSATVSGNLTAEVSRVMYEFYTVRSFAEIAGSADR